MISIFLSFFVLSSAHGFSPSAIFQSQWGKVAESQTNPRNEVGHFPSWIHSLEGRLEVREQWRILDFTLRPRLAAELVRVNREWEQDATLFFQEAFVRADVSDSISLSLGRIQFGWGPADTVTPTNWMLPEIVWQASPYYEQLGVYRAQSNLSIGQSFSWVTAVELPSLRDSLETKKEARERFAKRWFTKAEQSWNHANQVLGLVAGQERIALGSAWRGGAYGSWTLSDAWQLYADAAWRKSIASKWNALSVAGARYTFENGAELRLEGIYNQAGSTRAELKRANQSLLFFSKKDLTTLYEARRASLLSKHYLYSGFRWVDPSFASTWLTNPGFGIRALHSITDHSTAVLGNFEAATSDWLSASIFYSIGFGEQDSEMRKIYDGTVGLGFRAAF